VGFLFHEAAGVFTTTNPKPTKSGLATHIGRIGDGFADMQGALPSRGHAPAALLMAAFFFSFGLFAILRPEKLRSAMDSFANTWKQGSWHPYRMPLPILRLVVGGTGIGGAAMFGYIAYATLSR
jgi:hypothetical protein